MSQNDTVTPKRALLLDPDLFFAVKVRDTLKHIGMQTTAVRQVAEWTRQLEGERFDIALVNTAARGVEWREAIANARAVGLPVIAYGSHIDTDAQAQARTAGATRVIANSKLAADLPMIVEQTLQRTRDAASQAVAESGSATPLDRDTQDDDA